MKLLKQISCFLVILGSITLTFLFSSPGAQATVTNGNIHYYEESSTSSTVGSTSSTTDSSSSTSSTDSRSDSSSTSSSTSGTDSSSTSASTSDTDSSSSSTDSTDSSGTDSSSSDTSGTDSTSQGTGTPTQQQPPGQSTPTIKEGTDGNFLKTNDTVNYLFVVVGVIFVLIAIYNLKKV